jgi:hypothetical protein
MQQIFLKKIEVLRNLRSTLGLLGINPQMPRVSQKTPKEKEI